MSSGDGSDLVKWARARAGRGPAHRYRGELNRAGLGVVALVWALLELGVVFGGLTPPARAADATRAAFSGAGTFTHPVTGQVYGKGGLATLTVTTSADTKCVDVNRSWEGKKLTQTSDTARTSWTFVLDVPTAAGSYAATATASPGFNASGKEPACTGSSPGNATATASYVVDAAAPIVTGTASPAPNAAGWNRSNVSIAWNATDAASGVKSGPTPASDTVTAPTAGVTRTATASDQVGNVGTGSLLVRLDKEAPTISASRSPAPNARGWNNSDVTVAFTCADSLSGIKSCPGTAVVSSEGTDQSVTGKAADNADNEATVTLGAISVDKTRPTLTGAPTTAPNGHGWYAGDVRIAWTASDDRSGIASAPADSTITGEGGALLASASVSDRAGNTATADSAPVRIDRSPPQTSATAPSGWTNRDQTIALSAADALSGVAAVHHRVDGGPQRTGASVEIAGDGVHSLEFWSVDRAGNEEPHRTVEVRIDGSSPSIAFTRSPAANLNGWHRDDVTVSFQCEDERSGIASCTPQQVVSTEGVDQPVEGTATDRAGNSVSATALVSLDRTAPTMEAAADRAPNDESAGNGRGWYADDVAVSFTCADSLSGIDACPSPRTVGEGYDQSVSATSLDAAGNAAGAGVAGINVDRTRPTLSGGPTAGPNDAGWYRGDVEVRWSCADALSGIAGSCPEDSVVEGEGTDLAAFASVGDRAGNVRDASVGGLRIDRRAPSTTADLPPALESTWYAGPVEVTLDGRDGLSGVARTLYSVDGGSEQEYDGTFSHDLPGSHAISFWSVDRAGNAEAPSTITIKIDDRRPSIWGARTPAGNRHGWNNAPVTVSFDCHDAESGVAGCIADGSADSTFVLAGPTTAEGVMVTGSAVDNAGNRDEAAVGPIRIDRTRPTVGGAPRSPANGFGWHRGDVTIDWTAADGLSGIDGDGPAPSVITGEGRGLTAEPVTARDRAGNVSESVRGPAVDIDRTPPTIDGETVAADGSPRRPNAAGWFNGAVRVRFACSDRLAGVQECPGDVVLDSDGTDQSAAGRATDRADNAAEATVGGIDIDSRPPRSRAAIECTGDNGFCRGSSATVAFTASDALAAGAQGAASSGVEEVRYRIGSDPTVRSGESADVPLSGSGRATVEFWAVDRAGNQETPNRIVIDHDTIAPTVSHSVAPVPNAAGWNRDDATVTFSATDDSDGSGVDRLSDPVLVDRETAGQVIDGEAYDRAGNRGTDTAIVRLDETPPAIAADLPAPQGANGWYTAPVAATFSCTDPAGSDGAAGSGIATCSPRQLLDHGQSFRGRAEDRAGNTESVAVEAVRVDGDAPAITLDGIADGGVYTLGSVPAASCAAVDVGPAGLDGGCRVEVTGGLANGVGRFTFAATARDRAGNARTVQGAYSVRYPVRTGTAFWLTPINDTAHTRGAAVSAFKAGSTVPAKFRIVDAQGRVVRTNRPPVFLTPVRGSATTAPADEGAYGAVAAAGAEFAWSPADQHYQFNWGSPRSGAGFYWRIGVQLDDGTTHPVTIALR